MEISFEVGEEVFFQAYKEHEPSKGKVKRKGTLAELGRMQLDPDDTRIFYEVETVVCSNNYIFTITTASSLFKERPPFNKTLTY